VNAQYYDLKVEAPAVFVAATAPNVGPPTIPKEIQTINDKVHYSYCWCVVSSI
jgi:hypothetical protein